MTFCILALLRVEMCANIRLRISSKLTLLSTEVTVQDFGGGLVLSATATASFGVSDSSDVSPDVSDAILATLETD